MEYATIDTMFAKPAIAALKRTIVRDSPTKSCILIKSDGLNVTLAAGCKLTLRYTFPLVEGSGAFEALVHGETLDKLVQSHHDYGHSIFTVTNDGVSVSSAFADGNAKYTLFTEEFEPKWTREKFESAEMPHLADLSAPWLANALMAVKDSVGAKQTYLNCAWVWRDGNGKATMYSYDGKAANGYKAPFDFGSSEPVFMPDVWTLPAVLGVFKSVKEGEWSFYANQYQVTAIHRNSHYSVEMRYSKSDKRIPEVLDYASTTVGFNPTQHFDGSFVVNAQSLAKVAAQVAGMYKKNGDLCGESEYKYGNAVVLELKDGVLTVLANTKAGKRVFESTMPVALSETSFSFAVDVDKLAAALRKFKKQDVVISYHPTKAIRIDSDELPNVSWVSQLGVKYED